jgi:molybdopterin molybdotransferase
MNKRTITETELTTTLVPYQKARAMLADAFSPLPPSRVAVTGSRQLILATDIHASADIPGFDNSAMDGYAVDSNLASTASSETPYALDNALRIATGHPIPKSCDAVVPWEATRRDGDDAEITSPVSSGWNIRRRGAEVRAGDTILRKGDEITPLHIGVLSALGQRDVEVHRRPRVAVASSGDEIAQPGDDLDGPQVYDSNRFLVASVATAVGADVIDSVWLPDDPNAVEQWITKAAASADVVVTSGGASVGERDWIRHVVEQNAEVLFWHVGIKPGKPMALAVMNGALLFVLPGNPGATFACTHAFVVPALRTLAGGNIETGMQQATLTNDTRGDAKRTLLCPAKLTDTGVFTFPAPSSQLLTPYLQADVLAVIPPGGAAAGDIVDTITIVR